jgi:hypothetical protein
MKSFHNLIVACICLLFILVFSVPAQADQQANFTRRLNRHPVLHHALVRPVGGEVVFRVNRGTATPAQAIAAWRASPSHVALLPGITRITCTGRVCVGR